MSMASIGLVSPAGRQLMGVAVFFLEKNLTTFLVIASESDDLFSCRLLTTPIFPRHLSSVLSKFSYENNFRSGVSVTRWRASPGAVGKLCTSSVIMDSEIF